MTLSLEGLDLPEYAIISVSVLIIISLMIHITFAIIRHLKGDAVEFNIPFLGPYRIEANKELQKLEGDLRELYQGYITLQADLDHKSNVLKLINQVGQNAYKVFHVSLEYPNEKVHFHFDRAVNFILPAIVYAISAGKRGRHRISLLIPEDKNLVVLRAHGFSPQGSTESMPIDASFAGSAYTSKKLMYSGDVKNDVRNNRFPFYGTFEKTDYNSLVCAPIILFGSIAIGVLNIDSTEFHSFTKDHLEYVEYFANQISLLLLTYMHISTSKPAFETTAASVFTKRGDN
ncbi:hypothetical protein CEN49_21815 [Fischerella thermalis CCMEE 5273]|nr:hypothetical protein CEN49_21815 [Fischerella thermalis CCMEE 5273]